MSEHCGFPLPRAVSNGYGLHAVFLWHEVLLVKSHRWDLNANAKYRPADNLALSLGVQVSLLPCMLRLLMAPGLMDRHITTERHILPTGVLVARYLAPLCFNVMVLPIQIAYILGMSDTNNIWGTALEVMILFNGCCSTHHAGTLVLGILGTYLPKWNTDAQPPRVEDLSETANTHLQSSSQSSDQNETHDELQMRSSYADQAIDSSDPTPALSERAIRHSMATYNSTARAQHDSTHSGANNNIGIVHKPSQYEHPNKSQGHLPDCCNPQADTMEVTAVVAQPLPEQTEIVVRRRPRQRQRVIVLDVNGDVTAGE